MGRLRHGFTLVEMLVVLGIVALMAALLFPAFAHVREKGHQTSCASNMRQLGLALSAYAIDYDEQYPTSTLTDTSTTNIAWAGQIYPHLTTADVFRCPTDATTASPLSVVSYGLNANLAAASSLAALSAPARTVLLFEVSGDRALISDYAEGQTTGAGQAQVSASGNGLNGGLANLTGKGAGRVESAQYACGALDNSQAVTALPPDLDQYQHPGRHSASANFLLADGHVKRVASAQVSAGGNATAAAQDQSRSGCQFHGLGSGLFPCAEGAEGRKHAITFSAQ